MTFRKLNSGIYIDSSCNCIINLSEGWYIPDDWSQERRELMLEIERRCGQKFFEINNNTPANLSLDAWSSQDIPGLRETVFGKGILRQSK